VHPLLTLLGAMFIQQGPTILAAVIIGRGALTGQFERVWLLGWALVLLTAIPFQLLLAWSQSQFGIGFGALFKQRLLYGALKLEPDEIRHLGMGQFLERVMESEAVELLALSGGLLAVVSLIQLGVAGWVLAQGVGGWLHAVQLILWVVATLLFSWLYYRHGRAWMDTYRSMTNNLVERMVGHRTRLAQEDPRRWHEEEDRDLARYLELSERLDRTSIGLAALPGSWLAAGLVPIAYALVVGQVSVARLAVSLGGVLLASQALQTIMAGIQSAVQMTMSWDQVKPLFQAATRPTDVPLVTHLFQNKEQRAREQGTREQGASGPATLLPCDLAPLKRGEKMQAVIDLINNYFTVFGVLGTRVLAAAAILGAALVFNRLFVLVILGAVQRLTQKTKTTLDDELLEILRRPIGWLIILAGVWGAYLVLLEHLGPQLRAALPRGISLGVLLVLTLIAYRASAVPSRLLDGLAKRTSTRIDDLILPYVAVFIRAVIILASFVTVVITLRTLANPG